MAHHEEVFNSVKQLVVFDLKTAVDLLADKGFWNTEKSVYQNTVKNLNINVQLGRLIKEKNVYKLPGCKSNYDTHAQKLTQDLATVLKKYPKTIIHREVNVPIGLRADAILLIIKTKEGGGGLCAKCAIFEKIISEKFSYTEKKRHSWESWQGARQFLSELFGHPIPIFTFTTIAKDLDL